MPRSTNPGTVQHVHAFGDLPSSVSGSIIWDPSGNGDVRTFAELMEVVNSTPPPLKIYVVGLCPVPTGLHEMRSASFSGLQPGSVDTNVVDVADGGQVRNLRSVEASMLLRGHGTALSAWENDSTGPGVPQIYVIRDGAYIQSGTGSVAPVIDVAPGAFAIVSAIGPSSVSVQAGAPSAIRLGAGSTLVAISYDGTRFDDDFCSGPVGANLNYLQDGSLRFPSLPSFLGTVSNWVSNRSGGSGPTSLRPSFGFFTSLLDGTTYFDMSLVPPRPIWWNSVAGYFVDAAGVGPV